MGRRRGIWVLAAALAWTPVHAEPSAVEARAARDAAQRTLEAAEAAQVAQRAEFDAAAAVTEARRALGLAEEAEAWAAAVALPIERRPEAVAAVEAFQRRHPQPRSEPRPDPRARLRVLGALPDALVLVEVSVAIAPEAAPPSEAAVPTPAQRAAWRQTIAADTPALHDPTVDGRSRRLVDLVVATAEEALATHDETRTRRLQHALQISRSCDCARDLADEGAARVSAVQARLHDALGNTHAARLAWGQLLARHPDDPEARTRRWAILADLLRAGRTHEAGEIANARLEAGREVHALDRARANLVLAYAGWDASGRSEAVGARLRDVVRIVHRSRGAEAAALGRLAEAGLARLDGLPPP